jgi:hypothetical protein
VWHLSAVLSGVAVVITVKVPPEDLRQLIGVELNFDDDRGSVGGSLETNQRPAMTVEPFAHGPEGIGELGSSNPNLRYGGSLGFSGWTGSVDVLTVALLLAVVV